MARVAIAVIRRPFLTVERTYLTPALLGEL
jgi:hypothetical protein